MPVHREKEAKPVRTTRRETPGLVRREGDRPIITQAKPAKKPEHERKLNKPERKAEVSVARDEKTKKQVVVKSQRIRTRTRTLSPTEVKQMTKERIARDYGAAAAEMIPQRPEPTPTPKESDHEEVEDYEDDFEDYESDFEEDSEDEEPKVETPEPVPKTEAQKRELEEIRQAIKTENEMTRSRMTTPDMPEMKASVTPILDFSKSKRKTEVNKTAEKARKRGRDLLSMINLDSITYSFLDMPSIPYEVYMKIYGKSDTKQVTVQTNEDDMNEETQTTVIEMQNKWVQTPTDALGEKKYRLTKEERLGVGGDDATEVEPVIGVIDTTHLNEFLGWASDILIPVLQKSGNIFGGDKLPNQSKDMYFSDGFVTPNISDLPFLRGKAVTLVSCIPEEVSTVVTVHTISRMSFGESVICVWSITDLSKPLKVLTASNRVTAVCAVVQRFVIAGLTDGTVCLWDLKESSALHYGTANSDWVLRSPTYSTATNSHISPVTSVHELRDASKGSDFTPVQVCSLEETGTVIIWSVVQGRNLSSDEDLGLAHWGKVKLVKSSIFSVVSTLGKEIPPYVTCNALAVEQNGDVELYVTNSLGSVSHVSRYGTCMRPKAYKACDLVETTCLEICPFDPNYFLTGCNDGSIRLYYRNQELPLISLNARTADDSPQASIVALEWLYVRPFVFFALDSLSRIHIWDLGLSDMYPEVTLNLAKKKVTSVKLIQSSDTKQRPYFVLGRQDGNIEIHRLKDDYSNRASTEIHKDVKKFLKYFVSVDNLDRTCRTVYKFNMMVLDWLKPLQECHTLSCGSPSRIAIRAPEDLDEVLVLESKVVSAMMRLQKCGESDGLQPGEIVDFLSKKHRNLDGDIESQVITALQSGIRKGLICGLCNGKYALIGPNPRKMIAQCYNTVKHGPKCTCSLITAGKRHCCSFRYNTRSEFFKDPRKKKGGSKIRRMVGRGKEECNGECYVSAPSTVTVSEGCIQCRKKKVSFSSLSSVDLTA